MPSARLPAPPEILPNANERSGVHVLHARLALFALVALQCRDERAYRLRGVDLDAREQRTDAIAGLRHAAAQRRVGTSRRSGAPPRGIRQLGILEHRRAIAQRAGIVREPTGQVSSQLTSHGRKLQRTAH